MWCMDCLIVLPLSFIYFNQLDGPMFEITRILVSLQANIITLSRAIIVENWKKKKQLEAVILPNQVDSAHQHPSWMSCFSAHWSAPTPKPQSWTHLLPSTNTHASHTLEPYTHWNKRAVRIRHKEPKLSQNSTMEMDPFEHLQWVNHYISQIFHETQLCILFCSVNNPFRYEYFTIHIIWTSIFYFPFTHTSIDQVWHPCTPCKPWHQNPTVQCLVHFWKLC